MPDGRKDKKNKGWAQVLKLDKTKTNDKENQEVILKFFYGRGFDSVDCAISALFAHDIFERKGAWYYSDYFPEVDGRKAILGKDRVVEFLKNDSALLNRIVSDLDATLAVTYSDSDSENVNESQL